MFEYAYMDISRDGGQVVAEVKQFCKLEWDLLRIGVSVLCA